jgi:hypothetical protein
MDMRKKKPWKTACLRGGKGPKSGYLLIPYAKVGLADLGLLPLDARVNAEMDQTVRVVFGGHCDV